MTAGQRVGRRTPGELVLHPLALAGLAVLLLNDHVLKALAPGWLTGKLSDVAGLVFFPFLLLALVDVVVRGRREPGPHAAALAAVVTAAVFTAVKVWEPARMAYCWAIGALRYPVDALASTLAGAGAGPLTPAVVVADTGDLVAVVACAAVVVVRRRSRDATAYSGTPCAQVATTASSTARRS